ncbi:hypothetical protein [Corynebacterium halotolerans]|uniref:hypothetical protein n=1 Tax=Corynebacterium halotolerans TaxID=225326 RepID=UPI003CEF1C99
MGRLLLLLLIIVAVVLLWKAFGPKTWQKRQVTPAAPPRPVKGPDDDEDFLWNLEKNRFKERRAREAAAEEEEERMRRANKRYTEPDEPSSGAEREDGEEPRP